jgi:chromosome segregation ATPase
MATRQQPKLTREAFEAVANALYAHYGDTARITQDLMHAALGGGSRTTHSDWLRQWKERVAAGEAGIEKRIAVALERAIKPIASSLHTEAAATLNAREAEWTAERETLMAEQSKTASERDQLFKEKNQMADERERAAQAYRELQADCDNRGAETRAALSRLEAQTERAGTLEQTLEDARLDLTRMQARLSETDAQHAQEVAALQAVRDQLKLTHETAVNDARAALERAREETKDERARAERDKQTLQSEQRRLETELARTGAELASAQSALTRQEKAEEQRQAVHEAESAKLAKEIERWRSAYERSADEQKAVQALAGDIDTLRLELECLKRESSRPRKKKSKEA